MVWCNAIQFTAQKEYTQGFIARPTGGAISGRDKVSWM